MCFPHQEVPLPPFHLHSEMPHAVFYHAHLAHWHPPNASNEFALLSLACCSGRISLDGPIRLAVALLVIWAGLVEQPRVHLVAVAPNIS
jgi:hypothetical protein